MKSYNHDADSIFEAVGLERDDIKRCERLFEDTRDNLHDAGHTSRSHFVEALESICREDETMLRFVVRSALCDNCSSSGRQGIVIGSGNPSGIFENMPSELKSRLFKDLSRIMSETVKEFENEDSKDAEKDEKKNNDA